MRKSNLKRSDTDVGTPFGQPIKYSSKDNGFA